VLVSRHERSVFNLLVRMLRDPALAEDLAQEAFVRAFRHLSEFDPRYKFANWLLRIAHNAGIDAIRRRGPDVVSLDDEEHPDAAAAIPAREAEDALERVERLELGRVLDAAIDRLRPEFRKVMILRYHEELSYDEIAEVTGLPLGTVKSDLHRARNEIAAWLRAAGWKGSEGR
jgi:RNA polymerase sigma-70 factor (ECF subfamily)